MLLNKQKNTVNIMEKSSSEPVNTNEDIDRSTEHIFSVKIRI